MRFTPPIADRVLTRGFDYLSSLYVLGQHAAADYIPEGRLATGEPIKAVADWEAVGIGWDFYSGFFAALDHAGGWRSFYRHLYGQSPIVVGQRGKQGDIVGNIGNTGWSEGAHLHFDLWNSIQWFDSTAFYKNAWWAHDPELYLGKEQGMTDAQMEKILGEMRGLTNLVLVGLQSIINHQKAADKHVAAQADRVIGAMPKGATGAGLTFDETVEADQEAHRRGTG